MIEDPNVIFIGAGPIGLRAAIQLKLHEPTIKGDICTN